MSETLVMAFLVSSLIAYVISGGADFGVGVLELFAPRARRRQLRELGQHAIAPVWEANHVWVVVALVILFVAYPAVHVELTTKLHIPLLLMLAGIILRGTAFTFRYYDLEPDPATQRMWSALFRVGSLMVPMLFGALAAALSRGRIPVNADEGVYASYVAPWVGVFPFLTGVFVTSLFSWLAAVFLVGETQALRGRGEIEGPAEAELPEAGADFELHASMVRVARKATVVLVLAGALVSGSAYLEGVPWLIQSPPRPLAWVSVAAATLGVVALFRLLASRRVWTLRVLAGMVATAVVTGYFGAVYPVAVERTGGANLTWPAAAAGTSTMNAMATALVIASALILPGLAYLYRLFKSEPSAN